MKPKDLVKKLENDGWKIVRISGSHYIMKHVEKPGMPVIPLHNKDLKSGTLNNILKQAELK